MELVTGKDLGSVVQLGPLPITRAVDLLLQACDALAEAHALHIVHRDIKPENLFLADRPGKPPVLKLIDFGISKLPPKPDEVERRTTGVQERFGTALYMSPEQLQSSGAVDARSDVWSLGIVLHELLTGQSAFDGDDMPRLCASILNGEPHTLRAERPTAPEGLEAVILKCLQKRPERRYRNVAELAQDLVVYGPVDAEQRVKGIREIVVRSGASIRPPTPATAMTMQLLPNIEPPVVSAPSVRAMDIVGERHAPKLTARTTALIALSVVIAAVIVVVAMRAWHGAALPAPAAVQSAAHTSSVATIPTAITTETVLAPSSTSPVRHQQSKSMPPATIAVTTMTTTPVASTTSPTASSVAAPTVSSNATPTATASASAQPTATTDPVTL
jgi:serine/threonine-protein kinase